MEVTRVRLGRKLFVIYKHKCSVCKRLFPSTGLYRVTCGLLECQRIHGLLRTKQAYQQNIKFKVKECLYCHREFSYAGKKRVTCGRVKCRRVHNYTTVKRRHSSPEYQPVLKRYRERRKIMLLMLKELEQLAGV